MISLQNTVKVITEAPKTENGHGIRETSSVMYSLFFLHKEPFGNKSAHTEEWLPGKQIARPANCFVSNYLVCKA